MPVVLPSTGKQAGRKFIRTSSNPERVSDRLQKHGEEQPLVISRCMGICDSRESRGRSCSKICLVKVFIASNPENFLKTYAVLDDQSNQSLGRSKLFDYFNVPNNVVGVSGISLSNISMESSTCHNVAG